MNACGVGWVCISNEDDCLILFCCSYGFIHSGNSRKSFPVISEVIGSDFEVFRRDKEEGVMVFTFYFNIGLIAGADIVDRPFMFQVKGMAIEGGSSSVIKYSLVRDVDIKY